MNILWGPSSLNRTSISGITRTSVWTSPSFSLFGSLSVMVGFSFSTPFTSSVVVLVILLVIGPRIGMATMIFFLLIRCVSSISRRTVRSLSLRSQIRCRFSFQPGLSFFQNLSIVYLNGFLHYQFMQCRTQLTIFEHDDSYHLTCKERAQFSTWCCLV